MGPRKRSKPNPKEDIEPPVTQESEPLSSLGEETPNAPTKCRQSSIEPAKSGASTAHTVETPHSSKTWYGSPWPRGRKASPITQVAKESISATGSPASDDTATARVSTPQAPATPFRTPSVYLAKNIGSSSRSLPLAATTTKVNITSNAQGCPNGSANEPRDVEEDKSRSQRLKIECSGGEAPSNEKGKSAPSPEGPPTKETVVDGAKIAQHVSEPTSWLGWFSKAEGARNTGPVLVDTGIGGRELPLTNEADLEVATHNASQDPALSPKQRRNSDPSPVSSDVQQEQPPRSWFGLWNNTATRPQDVSSKSAFGPPLAPQDDNTNPNPEKQESKETTLDPQAAQGVSTETAESAKSNGWAFWSRETSSKEPGQVVSSSSEAGELAVANSPSQTKPESAVLNETRGLPKKATKRQRPQSLDTAQGSKSSHSETDTAKVAKPKAKVSVDSEAKPAVDTEPKSKQIPVNLLLPSFQQTYSVTTKAGLVQQLSRLLQLNSPSEPKHVDILSNPPRVKKALAIGIHGYFPAPLLRSVLGQPTGTSLRFANSAASSIHKWTQAHGYSCEVEKVALEGEGKIAERIDLLWKLLLNWIDKIRKADFVMIACHSQGVPVTVILVAKLIAFGCVNSARIGVCAMAGVNLGPFADYKSRWISGSAGELFDFALPDSRVSKDYESALDTALKFGVRIVYVGSIDDQLVSLESATFGPVSHPYIYRAVFVDGRVHAPDFLTHLVGFALKLRNLGISDHGLIRELSTPLAGSLYTGEGHSRIYDEESVYYLAVEHALETTTLEEVRPRIHRSSQTTSQNPHILPFAMRGLLEEERVRTELKGEVTELIMQFDEWKPATKVLKDVKYRLEGLKSKL